MKRTWPYLLLFAATMAVVHIASVALLPDVVMERVLERLARGGWNEITFHRRAGASERLVVRPSPDLLYDSCPFDVSRRPLRVHAEVPPGTYWSVSVFDAATDNIFAENDREAKGSTVDLLIVGPNGAAAAGRETVVHSPSARGLVLFRTLIDDDRRFAVLDAARRRASCKTD